MPAGKARTRTERRDGQSGADSSTRLRPVAHIDQQRCDRSVSCPVMRICPMHAVVPDESVGAEEAPTKGLRSLPGAHPSHGWRVDAGKCSGCLLCAQYCPHGAVQPRERTVA